MSKRQGSGTCPDCGDRMIILKTNHITPQMAHVYYQCKSMDCGARLVYDLSYSHHTTPSAVNFHDMAIKALNCLPPEKRREVGEMLLTQSKL